MLYKEFKPCASLAGIIKCFWVFEHFYPFQQEERMIPDGYIDFVYHYGTKPSLIINDKSIHKPSVFLGGHLISSAKLSFCGPLKMFGIKFYPWASSVLYSMPAYELSNQRIAIEDIAGKWIKDYYSILNTELNQNKHQKIIPMLEKSIVKWIGDGDVNGLLKYSIQSVIRSKGEITIDELSNELKYSRRQIQRVFQNQKGMSFQYYCRLVRVQNILKLYNLSSAKKFTSLAHQCGYYDQSHLIRDFTSLLGLPLKKYFKEEHLYLNNNHHHL